MTLLNLFSNDKEYMFFIKSYNVKNSILEILNTRFNCDISKILFNHFKYISDTYLDNFAEFNMILPYKKLKFLTTNINNIKLNYVINITNNKLLIDNININQN